MKKAYFVLDTVNELGQYYTVVCPVGIEHDNVTSKLESWAAPNKIKICMLASTKKKAFEVCEAWRKTHTENDENQFEYM